MRYLFLFLIIFTFGCKAKKDPVTGERPTPKRKKILTGVTITGVGIASFPKYSPSGEAWDAYAPFSTDPDLFVSIKWNDNPLYKSETRNECPFGTPVSFSTNLPIVVKTFDQPLLLEVFDEDGISNNDNVGYFTVLLTDYKDKEEVVLTQGELSVKLSATWIYQ